MGDIELIPGILLYAKSMGMDIEVFNMNVGQTGLHGKPWCVSTATMGATLPGRWWADFFDRNISSSGNHGIILQWI